MNIDLIPIEPVAPQSNTNGAFDLSATPAHLVSLIEQVIAAQIALYARTSATAPWIGYFARRADTGAILGSCSFVGPPQDGQVEIAYFTFPDFEGHGVARQAASRLIEKAKQSGAVSIVYAHTLPAKGASTRILTRLGFTQTGLAHDDEAGTVWRWELDLSGPG